MIENLKYEFEDIESVEQLEDFDNEYVYDIEVDGSTGTAYEITIDAANFPGTYKVYGDTLVKNRNGKNSPYQFIINRAKVDSNVTFTMEAEGDPSVDFSNADVKAA